MRTSFTEACIWQEVNKWSALTEITFWLCSDGFDPPHPKGTLRRQISTQTVLTNPYVAPGWKMTVSSLSEVKPGNTSRSHHLSVCNANFVGFCCKSSWQIFKTTSQNFIWAEVQLQHITFLYIFIYIDIYIMESYSQVFGIRSNLTQQMGYFSDLFKESPLTIKQHTTLEEDWKRSRWKRTDQIFSFVMSDAPVCNYLRLAIGLKATWGVVEAAVFVNCTPR